MKRSEMISIITDIIAEANVINYYYAIPLSEKILSACEQNGMLPPEYIKYTVNDEAPGNTLISFHLQWESEEDV